MSEAKTIKVLESLGGSAEMSEIRKRAREMYPELQLGRTIHNPLKALLEKKKVKCRGKLKRGGYGKNNIRAPKTYWTLTDIDKVIPPIKTAAQMLEEEYQKARAIVKTTEQLRQEKEQRTRKSWDEMLSPAEKKWNAEQLERAAKAQKLLDEIPMHEDIPVINTNILTPEIPAPPPVINTNTDNNNQKPKTLLEETGPIIDKIGQNLSELEENDKEDGTTLLSTVAVEIRKAIKKPYLDNLAKLAENVDKKEHHYRGRHDIVFEMLAYIKSKPDGKASVTEIMYKTMLSFSQLRKYLVILLKNELIEADAYKEKVYQITQKGHHYSDTMDSIPINFD